MVSTSGLRGTWKGGRFVSKDADVVIALYVNAAGRGRQSDEQLACFAILREWVRQHIRDRDEMYVMNEFMTEVEGRGYMFELRNVKWGNDNDPFYLLLQRTLKEMAEAFNLRSHDNCATSYALEYSWVRGNGIEYDTVRLGAYAYAVGVKVEVETAADFFIAEEF